MNMYSEGITHINSHEKQNKICNILVKYTKMQNKYCSGIPKYDILFIGELYVKQYILVQYTKVLFVFFYTMVGIGQMLIILNSLFKYVLYVPPFDL